MKTSTLPNVSDDDFDVVSKEVVCFCTGTNKNCPVCRGTGVFVYQVAVKKKHGD